MNIEREANAMYVRERAAIYGAAYDKAWASDAAIKVWEEAYERLQPRDRSEPDYHVNDRRARDKANTARYRFAVCEARRACNAWSEQNPHPNGPAHTHRYAPYELEGSDHLYE